MIIRLLGALALGSMLLGLEVAATPPMPSPSPSATMNPMPSGTEVAFVEGIQKDLTARFPTTQAAMAAGYFRYTNEDVDGAISYANLKWNSADPTQPSQLWYDVKGNLLGADFSVPQDQQLEPPALWGVQWQRWRSFHEHIHFVLAGPNGTEIYGGVSAKKFAKAGGNVDDPGAGTLVKMGLAKNVADVKRVFLFPSIWDLIVWVKPNPNGAFALKNPTVIPSANAEKDDD